MRAVASASVVLCPEESNDHKREGGTVIESRLPREPEACAVVVLGICHGHRARKPGTVGARTAPLPCDDRDRLDRIDPVSVDLGCGDELAEEGMGTVRPALEFRVKL